MREIRTIGGFEVREPTTVIGLKAIRDTLINKGIEDALKKIDSEIEHRWAIDGYWANVRLEKIYNV